MVLFLYCLLYAGAAVFLTASAARAVGYARQPVHLRWEIYPLPDGRLGRIKAIAVEVLFFKGLWEANRPLWWVSYPFHLGLYFTAAAVMLAVAAFQAASLAAGAVGAVLGLAGSLGLLIRRFTSRELRMYSTAADYFNLAWFALTFTLLVAGQWVRAAGSPGPVEMVRGAARFDTSLQIGVLPAAGLLCGIGLLAYIPMTHMAHFIAKYFTYHHVRWDDRAKVAAGLAYRPTWSARHINAAGGDRTWAEVASANPAQGGEK